MGGPLLLKSMLDIIMDVDDSSLQVLAEYSQTLRMKDIPGENVDTIVRYMKGNLLLLRNYGKLPTGVMVLVSNTFCLAACPKF